MLSKAASNKLISGLCSELIPNGVICLQYADDTILFMEKDENKTKNMKIFLTCFEQVSGMRINYSKSEIIPIELSSEETKSFADILGCRVGAFPIKYLGVPVSYSPLRTLHWNFADERFLHCCESWMGNAASSGGRLILLNSSLTSIIYFYMSMFLLPKMVIEKLDKHRKRFFWQEHEGRKRYHLVRWNRICRSKEKGGLGVKDLHKQNLSLLTKWWWKLETKQGLWQDVIRAKYFNQDTLTSVKTKFNDSQIWKAIMKTKYY